MASTRALKDRKYFTLAVHDPKKGACDTNDVFNDISTFSDFVQGLEMKIEYPNEEAVDAGMGEAQAYVADGDAWNWRSFPNVFYVPEVPYSRLSLAGDYKYERTTKHVVSKAGEVIGKCVDDDTRHLNVDAFAPGRLTKAEVAQLLGISTNDLHELVTKPKTASKPSSSSIPDERKILRIKVDKKNKFNDFSINDMTVLTQRDGFNYLGAFFKYKNHWDFSVIEKVRLDPKAQNPHLSLDKSNKDVNFIRQAATNTIQIKDRREPMAEIITEEGGKKSIAAFYTGPLTTAEVKALLNKDLTAARKEARTPSNGSSRKSSRKTEQK